MRLPVVAIIGRPNVGKSTLFNRVLRRRAAIVDDRPGVTRDRNYALAEWRGRDFYLVDTGGLVPHSRDRMESAIRRQVETALAEADLVLMTVDVKEGLTDTDRHIVQLVRRSGKPSVLAANKVDAAREESGIYDFYQLGLGEPLPVSAASGRGSGDLLDAVVEKLPPAAPTESLPAGIRVALLGKPNVGKSSLVNAITGQQRVIVDADPGTTRDAVDTWFEWQDKRLVLIDTAGLRRKTKGDDLEFYTRLRTERTIDQAQVGVLVLDGSQGLSHLDLSLAGMLDASDRAVVLAVNKWDLAADGNQANYIGWLRSQMPFLPHAEPVFTSAVRGEGIQHLLQEIVSAHNQWRKMLEPELLISAFEETVAKNQPPAPRGREVILYSIKQTGTQPPWFEVLTNQPKLLPESYRRYLIGGLRERLGIKGAPIRITYKKSAPPDDWQKRRYLPFGQRPRFRAER
jgi:GTP-binding protein